MSFRAGRYGSLTFDYLRSRFRHNFATDDNGSVVSAEDRLAAQFSLAF